MQIEWLSPPPPRASGRGTHDVAALHCPDAAGDITIAQFLQQAQLPSLPLLPHLLRPQQQEQQHATDALSHRAVQSNAAHSSAKQGPDSGNGSADGADAGSNASTKEHVAAIVGRFGLNDAQQSVAAHVAAWLPSIAAGTAPSPQLGKPQIGGKGPCLTAAGSGGRGGVGSSGTGSSPVCLVHGPFGTGKSTLLVALVHLLTSYQVGRCCTWRAEAWVCHARFCFSLIHHEQCVCWFCVAPGRASLVLGVPSFDKLQSTSSSLPCTQAMTAVMHIHVCPCIAAHTCHHFAPNPPCS